MKAGEGWSTPGSTPSMTGYLSPAVSTIPTSQIQPLRLCKTPLEAPKDPFVQHIGGQATPSSLFIGFQPVLLSQETDMDSNLQAVLPFSQHPEAHHISLHSNQSIPWTSAAADLCSDGSAGWQIDHVHRLSSTTLALDHPTYIGPRALPDRANISSPQAQTAMTPPALDQSSLSQPGDLPDGRGYPPAWDSQVSLLQPTGDISSLLPADNVWYSIYPDTYS